MSELVFCNNDGLFGLKIPMKIIQQILDICKASNGNETGGLLAGCYTKDLKWAVVVNIIGPPEDSKMGRTWFERGRVGVSEWLARLWENEKHYYLGEWHFHPYESSELSPCDEKQMNDFSKIRTLRCPEPVMLIIGGDPSKQPSFSSYVFPNKKGKIKMERSNCFDK